MKVNTRKRYSNVDTYQEVNRNLIKTLFNKVNRELLELKKLKEISYDITEWGVTKKWFPNFMHN